MYKKRFAAWGFHKNVPVRILPKRAGDGASMHMTPTLQNEDLLTLGLLTRARDLSVSFLEHGHRADLEMAGDIHLDGRPVNVNFSMKLVGIFLERGHGDLSGKVARKAFLMLEEVLSLPSPALIWNLMEMMYHMLTLKHERLLSMLLRHLNALISQRLSTNHPLVDILHDLQRCLEGTIHQRLTTSASPTQSSMRSQSDTESLSVTSIQTLESSIAVGSHPAAYDIPSLLRAVWLMNAELIFHSFDPNLSRLYSHLHWESCAMNMPSSVADAAKQWIWHIETQKGSKNIGDIYSRHHLAHALLSVDGTHVERAQVFEMNTFPLLSFQDLWQSTITAILNQWNPIFSSKKTGGSLSSGSLQGLPAVVKAGLLAPTKAEDQTTTYTGSFQSTAPTQFQANNVACAVRALMDLYTDQSSHVSNPFRGSVERFQWVVALREHSFGETDPQVIYELFLLEDMLISVGERQKAQHVRRMAIERAERFTGAITF